MRHSPWRWAIIGAASAAALSLGAQLIVVLAGLPWLPDTDQPGIRHGGALTISGDLARNLAILAALAGAAWLLRHSRFGLASLGTLAGAAVVNQIELVALHDTVDFMWVPRWVPLLGGGIADAADLLVPLAGLALAVALLATLLVGLRPARHHNLA